MTFGVVDHLLPKKKLLFFQTTLIWVGARSGLGF